MALLKNLLRVTNFIFPFVDFCYILQLEEYSTRRYLVALKKFLFRRNLQQRQRLVLTQRIKLTLFLSVAMYLGILTSIYIFTSGTTALVSYLGTTILIPLIVALADTVITPGTYLLKKRIRASAQRKLKNYKNIVTIVIAGSHGKSTTKTFLYELLRYHYNTKMALRNINTPMGIADWINKELHGGVDILIAEIDTYWVGEITDSCHMLRPRHAIVTSLGEQHLVRFKNQEELHQALLETFTCTTIDGLKLAPRELKNNLEKKGLNDIIYVDDIPYYAGRKIETPQLSETQKKDLSLALRMAEEFSIPEHIVVDICSKLTPPDRRQVQSKMHGFEVVDDSYNISFETAQKGITRAAELAKEKNKKLLIVTAGIPELGKENAQANTKLGQQMAITANYIAILKSDFHKAIIEGIPKKSSYSLYPSIDDFWLATESFPKDEWLILVQPELTDLYY
ncbi:MAG: Mur ligase family protein [Patescibacteria group bacterium]